MPIEPRTIPEVMERMMVLLRDEDEKLRRLSLRVESLEAQNKALIADLNKRMKA